MTDYFVTWEIDVSADSKEAAAKEAWRLMRNVNSTANVFRITDSNGNSEIVDLQEINEANNG